MTDESVLAVGLVERIGEANGRIRHNTHTGHSSTHEQPIPHHKEGLALVVQRLLDAEIGVIERPSDITAVGHRVVHGGERFSHPTPITPDVIATVRELSSLAPLHNPPNLAGIEVAQEIFPTAHQVAVFDTAFHQTMPAHAYRYAIPNSLYEEHAIRAYGFHGASHLFVSRAAAAYLGQEPEQTNLITIHLGNGCSITAVAQGQSIDTSMGFSPLPGLIMGTRSGDIDPAVIFFLSQKLHLPIGDIDQLLNKKSGMIGLTGENDLRDIEARYLAGEPTAVLALEMYAYRIRKYVGAYTAVLGHVDALVFTAGVGQNSTLVRQLVCQNLHALGIELDPAKNQTVSPNTISEIQSANGRVKLLIIPTNEELEIARQTWQLVQ
jgi:acetate kinase